MSEQPSTAAALPQPVDENKYSGDVVQYWLPMVLILLLVLMPARQPAKRDTGAVPRTEAMAVAQETMAKEAPAQEAVVQPVDRAGDVGMDVAAVPQDTAAQSSPTTPAQPADTAESASAATAQSIAGSTSQLTAASTTDAALTAPVAAAAADGAPAAGTADGQAVQTSTAQMPASEAVSATDANAATTQTTTVADATANRGVSASESEQLAADAETPAPAATETVTAEIADGGTSNDTQAAPVLATPVQPAYSPAVGKWTEVVVIDPNVFVAPQASPVQGAVDPWMGGGLERHPGVPPGVQALPPYPAMPPQGVAPGYYYSPHPYWRQPPPGWGWPPPYPYYYGHPPHGQAHQGPPPGYGAGGQPAEEAPRR